MARIYKESRYVLQLLIGKSYVAQYKDVKISFYTKNPNNQVMVDNGITIKRNIAEVKIESTLFDNLEEGLISYIVYGTKDGIPFIEERQSNYFLKAPLVSKPGEGGSCNLENKSVTPSMGDRNVDGYIIVEEDEGYDGLSRVVIDPQTLYNEGIEAGYDQGKTDGVNEQKGKLASINITENGTYTKEDGYNQIEVNVPDLNGSYDEGYSQGKTDGTNEQKSKLEAISITENGVYSKEDGYNHIEVNVPDLNGSYDEGYAQGKTDGVNEQKTKLETINITENGVYSKEDGYNHIEVNVIPKINVKEAGIKFSYSTFTEAPEWADFYGVTDMENMFYFCKNLKTIPHIDTSNATNMSNMFGNCDHLQTISMTDTSNVIDMSKIFFSCGDLQTISLLNTSNVTGMSYMFYHCYSLQTIPSLDTSKAVYMDNMFSSCRSLVSIPALNTQSLEMKSYYGFFDINELSNLTDFGGFLNLKYSLENDNNLKRLPNLTYQSCINILNGLYDFTGNGETPNSEQGKLKVHANFLTTVGDEISIGVAKGWTITA